MDDTEALRFATDCAFDDTETNDTPAGGPAEVFHPAESTPVLEIERRDIPTGRGNGVGTTAGALAAEAVAIAEDRARSDDEMMTEQIIEALLFSSDAPLSASRLADLVDSATPAVVRRHIDVLNQKYERAGLSFRIEAIARGYQMMTLPSLRPWLEKLNKQRRETRLSAAALETLSIVAYKQPIIRADVEAIRGVACGEVISRLREMGLVRVLGRAEVVGRPLLYGTTRKFLDIFGLVDLDDLPPMEALKLRPVSKPLEEVEPVKPPAVPVAPVEQREAVGV